MSGILEEENDPKDYEPSSESVSDEEENDDTCVSRDMHVSSVNNETIEDSTDNDNSDVDITDSAYEIKKLSIKDDNSDIVSNHDDEIEKEYLGDGWDWNHWEEHTIEEELEGPKEYDHYSGPHGMKPNIGKKFYTVLQCLFETTAMNRSFFLRLCGESNKYARKTMKQRNT